MADVIRARCTVIADLEFNAPKDMTPSELQSFQKELPAVLRLEQSDLQLCLEINEGSVDGRVELIPHEHGQIVLAEVHSIDAVCTKEFSARPING